MSHLSQVPLFSDFDDKAIEALSKRAVARFFQKNSIIITEGDLSDSLYMVLSGKLKVYVSDDEGKEAVLATLSEGDYFGELAFLDEEPRSASVACQENCRLSIISRKAFEDFLGDNHELAILMLRGLARMTRSMTENIKSLALMDVYGRVAKLLLDSATDEDGRMITEKMTQQDIASRVGSSREMVSRILKELKTGGYIDVEGKRIIVHKKLPDRW